MKKIITKALLGLLFVLGTIGVHAQNVNVNPGAGSYPDLTSAFAAVNAGTHTGSITIDIVGNTAEPVGGAVLNASGVGSASYTAILIRPSGGAARLITGATTAGLPMIDFNGADNVTVDGLNTGGNSLTIANTTVSATSGTSTIRFILDATNNTITNCNLQGSVSSSVATNGAVIFFSTGTSTGNDNNTISNNDIGPAGANLPTKAILGNGSTTTTAIGNSGNVINNNNIFDYFGAAVTSAGIATNGGCNTWSITNNRFYQTGTRTWTTGAVHNAINIGNSSATSGAQSFTITGNIIGYASNTQTGTYALTGSTGKFVGIQFNGISLGTASTVNNNTVASVSVSGVTSSGSSTSAPLIGILINNGLVTTNSNTIGSQSATASLVLSTNSTTATDVIGLYNFSTDITNAENNEIGGISVTNAAASGTFIIYGIRITTGSTLAANLTSNIVGGMVANSIQLNATGTSSQVVGIQTTNAPAVFTSNTVRNLTNNIGTGTGTGASVIGISVTGATPNHTLSQNTIHTLANTNATEASVVTGIQFTGSTANLVERNLVYNLLAPTTSTAAEINGIRVAGGTTTYRNNMIALGANQAIAIGTTATNTSTAGINGFNGALGTDAFIHNSVYIGGSATSGAGNSYALNGTQTTNTRSFRNNIFFNARSNSGGTGKNYAVKLNGTVANPVGLTVNNNLYFANGTGAVFGFYNSLDVANIAAWKTAVGQDAGSFEVNPQYLDPTNAIPDLHLHPTNVTGAEGNGFDLGVTNDFDGQTRASLTPVDIGADAGNFNGTDLIGPVITYTALTNTNLNTNRTVAVTITDVSGVATGGLSPRIYFAKNAGAYFSTQATLASGTVNNGVWTCTIDYALVGGVVATDVIRYFVVAQDVPGNLAANPSSGFTGTNVNTITTPPTTPNIYLISASISGIKTVCASGCDFTTLTGASGAFNTINSSVATGNIELQIAGDLTVGEDGTNGLNILAEQPEASNFTLKIYPTGAVRAITGSANNALIRMNGSSRVTIDGSIGGTGTDRSLTITNTSVTTPSVVLLGSVGTTPITNSTLKNCVIINGVNTSSAVVISDAGTLGNAGFFSNITIQNNDIQKAFVGVFASGGTIPQNGSNLTYTQNTINTSGANAIRTVGLYMQGVNGATISNNIVGNLDGTNTENDTGIWLAVGTINATVSNNTVSNYGYTGTGAFSTFGINVTSGVSASNINVTDNTVSNIVANGSITSTAAAAGIVAGGSSGGVTIQRNIVQGIRSTNTGTFGAYGIDLNGGNNNVVRNNFVSDVTGDMTGGAAFSVTFGIFGIRVSAGTGHQIYHNSVNLYGARTGTATSSLLTAAFALVNATSIGVDVRNNIFANNITGGTTSIANVAVYLPSGGTSAMNLTWNNNLYYSGTDAARQGVGQAGTTAGTNFFTTLPALAAYSGTLSAAATNDNASQAFTTAVPYVSATDLHLATSNDLGTPLASVTDDFDNQLRSATTPDIGADEIVNAVCSLSLTSAVGTNAQTVCLNTAITNITYSNTAALGATGATFGGLPTGVTGSWSGDAITISGSPSAGGTFNYTVTLVGGTCAGVTANGTITVTADNTAGAASSTPTLCINTPITSITHSTTGATGIGTPTGLPAGVTAAWAANTITLSGTPTQSGTFSYSIPLTGGCGTVNATGSITVTADNTAGAASSSPTLCINTALTNITHSTTGATGIGTPTGLPAGVIANWAANTITLSGTPTASGTFSYSIPLTGGCGTVNATGTITVTVVNTTGAASSSPTLCINTALTNITHSTTGATGIGTPTGLPAGVTAAWAANTITLSGTPTQSGTFSYSIPLTGGCGTVNATGTINVTVVNTTGAASSSPTLCINTLLTNITHSTTGATGIGTPTGLPAGVTAAWAANTITLSGTPTQSGTFSYSIPLTGGCGTVNATGSITVTADNTAGAASSSPTLCINTALTNITHSTTGATGIGTPTGLPAGVIANWAANTITLSGTPTASGTFSYSIPLTGGCGTVNATGTITVTVVNTTGAASSSPTLCINTALTNITHSTTGATGIGTPTGLPAGVTAAWAANTITLSGTPTASGTFSYSIPLTGGCGTVNATGTITVKPTPASALTASKVDVCPNTEVTLDAHCSIPTATVNWNPGAPTVTPAAATLPYVYKASCTFDGCTGNESSIEVRTQRILVDMKDLDVGTLPLPIARAVKDNMAPTNLINAPTFPRRWTFIANGCEASESAVFQLSGPVNFSTIDNAATYAMFANDAGGFYSLDHPNYGNGGSFPNGTYTLTIELRSQDGVGGPFPKNRVATGSLLATRLLTFTVGTPLARVAVEAGELLNTNALGSVGVFPNPVANTLHLKVSEAKGQSVQVNLMDVSGRLLLQRAFIPETNQHQEEFEVSHLTNGIYFLRVNTDTKNATLKVIKAE